MYLLKQFSKVFAVKKVGWWGGGGELQQPPRPEREGVAAKINTFCSFHFLIFPFCHNNDYVPEILET